MKVILLSALLSFALPSDVTPITKTPAQTRIQKALATIASSPDSFKNYNELAMALSRRARETADTEFYARGHQALRVSESLEPANFGARRTRTWLLLGQHRFQEAMDLAMQLNQEVPDDVLVYGMLVDAHMELGNYAAAEQACQWMLDLRPGNVPGLTRTSYLREMFGDVEGALQIMAEAYHSIAPSEREDQAWILTQMAHLHRSIGRGDMARTLLNRALELFPSYHYALAELAKVQLQAGEHDSAIELLQRRFDAAAHPENLLDLGLAIQAAGDEERAAELFARFETGALAESESLDNANRELALYLLDHATGRAEQALRIATLERERRHDVFTLETYAWALLANDRVEEARQEIEQALAVGQRDARLFYHAGAIMIRAGEVEEGRVHLNACLALNPHSSVAQAAKNLLATL